MTPAELRQRRLALGFSTALMAEILRIQPQELEAWEAGTQPIRDAESIREGLDKLLTMRRSASPVCYMEEVLEDE